MAFVLGEVIATLEYNWFVLLGLGTIGFLALFVTRNMKYGLLLLVFFISCFLGIFLTCEARKQYNASTVFVTQEKVCIEGTIGEILVKNEKEYCFIRNAKIVAHHKYYYYDKIIVYLQNKYQTKYGNLVKMEATYKVFSKARNPGNFDEENYYYSIGVSCKFYEESLIVTNTHYNEIVEWLLKIRRMLKDTIYKICNEKDASIFSAILLGEKELDETTNNLYQANGISHILSISGLHISIIGLGVYQLLRRKFLFPVSGVGAIVIMICYGVMTGGAVTIIRAIAMFMMKLVGDILGRTYDMITATAVAGAILLVDNPFYLNNTGFLLSFFAILAIAVFTPITEKYFQMSHSFLKSINISLLVTILTTPIILNSYFEIPAYSVLINLIVIPLTGILLVSGLAASVIGVFAVAFGTFIIGIGCAILRFYELLCTLFLKLPYSTITIGKISFMQIVLYYAIVIGFAIGMQKINQRNLDSNFWKVRYLKRGVCAAFCILLLITLFYKPYGKDLQITLIDVGQGDCILIQTPEKKTILIDAGSADITNVAKYRIVPAIKSKGISKIDYVFLTHMDSDHTNGVFEILENYSDYDLQIENLILAENTNSKEEYQELLAKTKACNIKVQYISSGAELTEQSTKIKCLHPTKTYQAKDKNSGSLVLGLQYQQFSILFTGDLDVEGEQALIKSKIVKDYDLLKVAHHGSKTSSSKEFLSIVKPKAALISCGVNNRYGHPSKDTLDKLDDIGCEEYITNECGAIQIKSDGKDYTISSYLQE